MKAGDISHLIGRPAIYELFFIDNGQPKQEKIVIMRNVEYCSLSVFDC